MPTTDGIKAVAGWILFLVEYSDGPIVQLNRVPATGRPKRTSRYREFAVLQHARIQLRCTPNRQRNSSSDHVTGRQISDASRQNTLSQHCCAQTIWYYGYRAHARLAETTLNTCTDQVSGDGMC